MTIRINRSGAPVALRLFSSRFPIRIHLRLFGYWNFSGAWRLVLGA